MKISVITVCLNSERTIERTIQSVISQNDRDYEYIIIDGKSTDRTLEIIAKYKSNISTIISEPDGGIYDAMNKGIAAASGDVIGIINSDDWYESGVFEAVRKCFQESDAEVVYGKQNLIGEDGTITTQVPSDIERLRYEMETPHSTVFIRKKTYEKYGMFQLKYKIAADYDLMLRLYTEKVKFIYIDKVLANFRLGGTAQRQGEKCVEETLAISRSYLPCVSIEKRELYKDIILRIHHTFHFVKIVDDTPWKLPDILRGKLGVGLKDDIAIFGAGMWGLKVYDILSKGDMRPAFFVDNDSGKWDSESDIKVFPPVVLKSFKGVLLAVVQNHSTEILSQVKGMSNPDVYCITWEEILV